jgi:epoxyqueuosine reductase
VAPYVLDARRCISYLTIEHRGDIDPALRDAAGEWLFGCDVCQDVCPWNAKAPPSKEAAFRPSIPLERREDLLSMTPEQFRARFRGSAISRAKRAGLLRNAALTLGRRRDADARSALTRALEDPEPSVRTAAAWALETIDSRRDRSGE